MKKFTKILALTLVLIMSVTLLASCAAPNKDPEKAKEALEENDYEVLLTDISILGAFAPYDGLEYSLVAGTKDGEEGLVVYYFEDADAANEAWDDIEDEIEEAKEEEPDLIAKKSGSMIYFGTKAAIKAAK